MITVSPFKIPIQVVYTNSSDFVCYRVCVAILMMAVQGLVPFTTARSKEQPLVYTLYNYVAQDPVPEKTTVKVLAFDADLIQDFQ